MAGGGWQGLGLGEDGRLGGRRLELLLTLRHELQGRRVC